MPNVEYEVTKGVGKVVQELHEMFELVFFLLWWLQYIYLCCWAIGEAVGVIEMVVDK